MAVYEVSWHGPEVIYRFTGIWKWVVRWWRKRPFSFSKKIPSTFSLNWVFPNQGGCSQFLISSRKFDSSINCWKMNFHFFEKCYFLCIESFRVDFWCVHRLELLNVCNQCVTLPNSPAYKAYPRNNPSKNFPNRWILDWSCAEMEYYSDNEPNGIIGSPNGSPKRLSYGVFPSKKRSWIFPR